MEKIYFEKSYFFWKFENFRKNQKKINGNSKIPLEMFDVFEKFSTIFDFFENFQNFQKKYFFQNKISPWWKNIFWSDFFLIIRAWS